MFARAVMAAALACGLLVLFGCGKRDGDYYSQKSAAGTGTQSLDVAGTYLADTDNFGFNMLTIYQSGNSLTAADNGGGSWSGTLSDIAVEENAGTGGSTITSWRGEVNLAGINEVDDEMALDGSLVITPSTAGNVIQIIAEFENFGNGLTGPIILTQTSAVPGGVPGAAGGETGGAGSGAANK